MPRLRSFVLCLFMSVCGSTHAQTTGEQQVNLPHHLPDEGGVNWDVQGDGSIGDGGGDQYDGGGHLYLDNGTQFHTPTGTGSSAPSATRSRSARCPTWG